jgi:hypothetical protein
MNKLSAIAQAAADIAAIEPDPAKVVRRTRELMTNIFEATNDPSNPDNYRITVDRSPDLGGTARVRIKHKDGIDTFVGSSRVER